MKKKVPVTRENPLDRNLKLAHALKEALLMFDELNQKPPVSSSTSLGECNAARIDELRGVIKQLEADKENLISQLNAAKQAANDYYEELKELRQAVANVAEFRRRLREFAFETRVEILPCRTTDR
jgi:hypothetical protein